MWRASGTWSHTLEASYVDTEDLALAAAGVTLRRRTGGPDEGWHLKRPTVDGARVETRVPLGAADGPVPEELVTYVRALVRDRPLVRVATMLNQREVHALLDAEGAELAEVCDDRVRGTALVGPRAADGDGELLWREWEVELGGGEPDLLDAAAALLGEAGAAPASSESKLQRVLGTEPTASSSGLGPDQAGAVLWNHVAAQVAELKARDPEVRTDEPDGVHKMPVASRRAAERLADVRSVARPERHRTAARRAQGPRRRPRPGR